MFDKSRPIVQVCIALVMVAVLLGACASAAQPEREYQAAEEIAPAAPPSPIDKAAGEAMSDTGQTYNVAVTSVQQTDRLVIKNASLNLIVNEPPESLAAISALAEELGGYVVSANLYKETLPSGAEAPRGSITIRVPAERLNEALERIKAESDQDPQTENITSQDVTSEYVDLQSRLKNLEAAEAQLTQIMEEARRTEDVLNVYNQLVQVREQIEVIKGQIKYFEQSAALSSISVELIADEAVQPLEIGGWKPGGIAKEALQALINTMKFLANALIWIIIYVLPVLLVLYLIVFLPISLIWRAWKRRRAARKQASTPPAPPAPSSQ